VKKRDVLAKAKLLRAVRRRNIKFKSHNFVVKTLSRPTPIFDSMTQAIKDQIINLMNINKRLIKERRKR